MMSTSDIPDNAALPREGLIDTAVRFLTNPNVVDRPFAQKQSFLKSKGMTDEEINIACERANVHAAKPLQNAVIPMYNIPQHAVAPQPLSLWIRVRELLHSLALLGGLGYVIYWVYKAYIEPFLFGRPKPKKSMEESLSSIEEAVCNVGKWTSELKSEIRSEFSRISQERESGAARSLAEIKSDIATVKGLLLSRQQFPRAPNISSLRTNQNVKPSIPVWQMSADQKTDQKEDEESDVNKVTHRSSHLDNSTDKLSLDTLNDTTSIKETDENCSSKILTDSSDNAPSGISSEVCQ
ncbi:Peroxisomal membrane protein PEX14 [Frankliniella fusca]|uniref:Peroxisomal membrane protein PEX14 n=1 Tax=Frankliniella fusca TaxID=407009 RepID=A0AAE1LRY2_9NEOP|nr:Peroxisomal membrane protein PEX14 [Frankliniella fusca]